MIYIVRSGTKGMKWYHRYHQSYETKPTRSGKIGEEHFDTLDKNFKKNKITEEVLQKYKQKEKNLSRVRVNKNTEGYLYTDKKGNPVGMVNVEDKGNGIKYIQGLEVFSNNKNKGYGKKLLDKAVKEMGATDLSVRKNNKVAIDMYKKYGFNIDSEDDNMLYMKYDDKKYYDKNAAKANEITKTLSKKEKDWLGYDEANSRILQESYDDPRVGNIYAKVLEVRNTPMSMVEIWKFGRIGTVAIATRNDKSARGKGYAKELVNEANKWFDYYQKDIETLEWSAVKDNKASRALAEKMGFKLSDRDGKKYAIYYKNKKGLKKITQKEKNELKELYKKYNKEGFLNDDNFQRMVSLYYKNDGSYIV